MLSFTKKFQSLSLDTQIGRTIAVSLLGPEGGRFVEIFKCTVIKIHDRETAKIQKKTLLKLLAKIQLMITEKQLVVSQNDLLVNYLWSFYKEISKLLEATRDPEAKVDLTNITSNLFQIKNETSRLISPFMTPKNITKFEDFTAFVTRPEFLNAFFSNPDFKSIREETLHTLTFSISRCSEFMVNHLHESDFIFRDKLKKCLIDVCPRLRVVPKGTFKGSEFCHIHHSIYVTSEITSPSMTRWLNDEARKAIFAEFLKKKGKEDLFNFSRELDRVKSTTRPELRKKRLSVVYFQHFSLPDPEKNRPVPRRPSRIYAESLQPPNQAEAEVDKQETDFLIQMAQEFHENFIKSEGFSQWSQSITLPEPIQREMEAELKEKGLTLDNFKHAGTLNAEQIRNRELGVGKKRSDNFDEKLIGAIRINEEPSSIKKEEAAETKKEEVSKKEADSIIETKKEDLITIHTECQPSNNGLDTPVLQGRDRVPSEDYTVQDLLADSDDEKEKK